MYELKDSAWNKGVWVSEWLIQVKLLNVLSGCNKYNGDKFISVVILYLSMEL